MNRRRFVQASVLAGAALASSPIRANVPGSDSRLSFKLKYAPHPGMFAKSAGDDILDQIKFAADQGFRAWEDNGIGGRAPELQEKIGNTLSDLGMQMGVFVAYAEFIKPTFANPSPEFKDEFLKTLENAVAISKRVNAKWFTVVPGSIDQPFLGDKEPNRYGGPRLSEGYQMANVIDLLRSGAEVLEPHGVTMVLEPLNWHRDHGGVFLEYSDQAYAICRAVNSPACKILFDIYHAQISEGNLIPNIERCWSEIAYFQVGDNPGRKEPGTGEINYRNIFRYIHDRAAKEGRDFILGMEHGNSLPGPEGEKAVIEAYRAADGF